MRLSSMTKEYCETIRNWRNLDIDAYRTPFLLTREMQEDFYYKVICDRNAKDRFWAVMHSENGIECFIGMVGLINISLENRNAEISIVIDPGARGRGYGKQALGLLLIEGYNRLNLDNIYGECYTCNPAMDFWLNICKEKRVDFVEIPFTKYVNGKYHDSIYFNFERPK